MPIANMDIDLLRTFATIADTGSFTRAAERLGRTQSTVSLQMKRLEDVLGRTVFRRNARMVRITADGEVLLTYVREILRLNDEAVARLREPDLTGLVRIGTPEDFATTHLPAVLSAFARSYPQVALEVTCDLTLNLLERHQRGEFDLVLLKREPMGPFNGVKVWREPLVWAGSEAAPPRAGEPVPLVVSPHPCVYRCRALSALDRAGRAWRVAYTSPSLAGTQAAVRAGLGIAVLPRDMVPSDFKRYGGSEGLPELEDTEIALCPAPGPRSKPAERLAEHIVSSLERRAPGLASPFAEESPPFALAGP